MVGVSFMVGLTGALKWTLRALTWLQWRYFKSFKATFWVGYYLAPKLIDECRNHRKLDFSYVQCFLERAHPLLFRKLSRPGSRWHKDSFLLWFLCFECGN
jgi:hypothetical protein